MLMAKKSETGARAIGVPRDEARDDGVNEKRIAAVDEEVELVLFSFRRCHAGRSRRGTSPHPTGL